MESSGTSITESLSAFPMEQLMKVSENFGFRNVWLLDGWFNYLYGLRLAKTKKISNIVFKKFIKHFLNVVVNVDLPKLELFLLVLFWGIFFFVGFSEFKLKCMSFFTSYIDNVTFTLI